MTRKERRIQTNALKVLASSSSTEELTKSIELTDARIASAKHYKLHPQIVRDLEEQRETILIALAAFTKATGGAQ
jgi:molybdopterin biosynthesis enzyme MoaB